MAVAARADRLTQNWKEGLKAIEETKFTPGKAIAAAEAKSKGKAVSVHYVILSGKLSIWVHCYANEKCWIVPVDPKTGKATDMREGASADMSCPTASEATRLMEEFKFPLTKAMEVAEAHSKGTALTGKTDVQEGNLTITVSSAVVDKLMLVTVDGKSGKVTKMEEEKRSQQPGG
jgi:uncharacterized membrane protein YkoI